MVNSLDPCVPVVFDRELEAPAVGCWLWLPEDVLSVRLLRSLDPTASWLPEAPVLTGAGKLWRLPRELYDAQTLARLWETSGRPAYARVLPPVSPVGMLQALKPRPGFTLRREQQQAIAPVLAGSSGIIALGCGGGKTVLGLYLATMCPGKTLIVATQRAHLENWVLEARTFFDGVDDAVGWATTNGSGLDKPVVLATVQTMARLLETGAWSPALARSFGLAIYDEAHHLAAVTFLPTAAAIGGRRVALSATPARIDYQDIRYSAAVGKILYENRGQVLAPTFRLRSVSLTAPPVSAVPAEPGRVEGWVTSHPEMLEAARSLIVGLVAEGRKVYVISRSTNVARVAALLPPGMSGVITGETPAEDRLHQLNAYDVVCVTAGVGQENYNRKDLDTLVFLSLPNAYKHAAPLVQQATGRIQREMDGKMPCEVWLLCPAGERVSRSHANKLLGWARKQGYTVSKDRSVGPTARRTKDGLF